MSPPQGWLKGGAAIVQTEGWVAIDGEAPQQGWLTGGLAKPASVIPSAPRVDAKGAWKMLAGKNELGLKNLIFDEVGKRRVRNLLKRLRALKETLQARRVEEEEAAREKAEAAMEIDYSNDQEVDLSPPLQGLQGKAYESDFFNQRAWETESQLILDSEAVLEHRWINDWNGINKKEAFRTMIETAVKKYEELMKHKASHTTPHTQDVDHLAAVRQVIAKHQVNLRRLFCYYSAELLPDGPVENNKMQRMSCEMWLQFSDLLGFSDDKGLSHQELEGIFTATNDAAALLAVKTPPGHGGVRPVDSDSASLSRGEWYEALLRVGFLQFERQMTGGAGAELPYQASDAIDIFLTRLIAQVPEAAVEDPDIFRSHCLYTPQMEVTIRDHWSVLTASYNVFRSTQPRHGGILFELETWEAMLTNLELLPNKVDRAKAIQIFQRSQMALTDELSNRPRLSEISKWEFAEALSRLADHVGMGGPGETKSTCGADLAARFDVLMEHIVECMALNFGFYLGSGDDDADDDDEEFDLDEVDRSGPSVPQKTPEATTMPDCLEDEPAPQPLARPEELDEELDKNDQDDKEFDELFIDEDSKF